MLLSARFLGSLKRLSYLDVAKVEEALRILPECYGRPLLRAGISIRRLRKNIYECRAGLKIRLLFRANAGALEVFFIGSHDEIRQLIRGL